MRVYAELYRVTYRNDAGYNLAQEASRQRIWAGPAEPRPLRRDWERMSAAEGRLRMAIRILSAEDLTDANLAVVDGQEYRVLGMIHEPPHGWEVMLGRWPS